MSSIISRVRDWISPGKTTKSRPPDKTPINITAPQQVESMPHGRVLVVDDIEINLDIAETILKAYDIQTDRATSGLAALEKIENGEVYDIIFMDHMMPGMDGLETTKNIRNLNYNRPIVALTANAIKDTEEIFMHSGFSGFISKPIDYTHMEKYLFKFIRDKELLK